jgi:hypothetical protein
LKENAMALGTMTKNAGESLMADAAYLDQVSFPGDGAYTTGGSVGFQAALAALVGDARDVIAVVPLNCGGYLPQYVAGDPGALKVIDIASGLEVAATTNLSGTTFNLLVISK